MRPAAAGSFRISSVVSSHASRFSSRHRRGSQIQDAPDRGDRQVDAPESGFAATSVVRRCRKKRLSLMLKTVAVPSAIFLAGWWSQCSAMKRSSLLTPIFNSRRICECPRT